MLNSAHSGYYSLKWMPAYCYNRSTLTHQLQRGVVSKPKPLVDLEAVRALDTLLPRQKGRGMDDQQETVKQQVQPTACSLHSLAVEMTEVIREGLTWGIPEVDHDPLPPAFLTR